MVAAAAVEPGGMQRTPLIGALALGAALTAPAPALAGSDVTVYSTFDALWSVEVNYSHRLVYEKPASATESASYRLSGNLNGLQFEDEYLMNSMSAKADGTVSTTSETSTTNPEGTSATCKGGDAKQGGSAVLGREGAPTYGSTAVWFSPIIATEVAVDCDDTDGRSYPGSFSVGTAGLTPAGPAGSWARTTTTLAMVDAPRWELPVNISRSGKECPGWDEAYSKSCTITAVGKVTFFRTDRREEVNLLAPSEPAPAPKPEEPKPQPKPKAPKADKPKLDRKARAMRTSVRCEWNCDIGIGVFTHRKNGKPYVKPVRNRKFKATGGAAATTVSVPLSRAQVQTLQERKGATVVVTITMDGTTTTQTFKVKG